MPTTIISSGQVSWKRRMKPRVQEPWAIRSNSPFCSTEVTIFSHPKWTRFLFERGTNWKNNSFSDQCTWISWNDTYDFHILVTLIAGLTYSTSSSLPTIIYWCSYFLGFIKTSWKDNWSWGSLITVPIWFYAILREYKEFPDPQV